MQTVSSADGGKKPFVRTRVIYLAPTVVKPTQNKLYYQADSHRLSGRDCKRALCLLVQNPPEASREWRCAVWSGCIITEAVIK